MQKIRTFFSKNLTDLVLSFKDIRNQHGEKTLHPHIQANWWKKPFFNLKPPPKKKLGTFFQKPTSFS